MREAQRGSKGPCWGTINNERVKGMTMERRTVEYLFTNDELIDKLHEYGLQFDAVEGCWKADSVDLLRFIGMVEEAYISHYERKIDAM